MKIRKLFINGRKRPWTEVQNDPGVEGSVTLAWVNNRKHLTAFHSVGGTSLNIDLWEPVLDQLNGHALHVSGLERLSDGRVVRQIWIIDL